MRFTYELSPRPLDDGPIRIQLDTNQRCSFGTKLKYIAVCILKYAQTAELNPI